VRLVRETGKPIAQVAWDLGMNEGTPTADLPPAVRGERQQDGAIRDRRHPPKFTQQVIELATTVLGRDLR
jgi:hypothetical protein